MLFSPGESAGGGYLDGAVSDTVQQDAPCSDSESSGSCGDDDRGRGEAHILIGRRGDGLCCAPSVFGRAPHDCGHLEFHVFISTGNQNADERSCRLELYLSYASESAGRSWSVEKGRKKSGALWRGIETSDRLGQLSDCFGAVDFKALDDKGKVPDRRFPFLYFGMTDAGGRIH